VRARLVRSIARRYARSASLARSTMLAGVVSALLVGIFVTLSAFTMSGQQVADRDLGRYGSALKLTLVRDSYTLDLDGLDGVGNPPPGDTRTVESYATAVRHAGADDVVVVLESFDIYPARIDAPFAFYVETEWTANPFPGYTLAEGRWPSRSGEVVLTEGLRRKTGPADTLPVLSGNERLRVVGTARDRFGDSSEILAAAGTWDSLGAATQRRFPRLGAMASLYWNGGEPRAVTAALTAVMHREYPDFPRDDLATAIGRAVQTRAEYVARERQTWVDKIPLAYDLPSLGLPLLSVLAVFGLNSRRFRRSLGTLGSIGMRRREAVAALALATTGWVLAATMLGALGGAGLGAAGRAVADRVLAGPISPYPDLVAPAGRLLWVTAVACLAAAVMLFLATRPGRGPARAGCRLPAVTPIRHALGILAGAAVVVQARRVDEVPEAMVLAGVLAGALLLFTPELVGAALRLLPVVEPRIRLGRRQLDADRDRAVGAVVVLAAALGAPLALLTLLATLISTVQADTVPAVAWGQLVLSGLDGNSDPPPSEVVDAVTDHVAFEAAPIRVGYLGTDHSHVVWAGADLGAVLAVDSVDEVARLNNAPLTASQTAALEGGGMLLTGQGGPTRRALVHLGNKGRGVLGTTAPLPVAYGDFEPVWLDPYGALVLTATARRLDLPVRRGALVYTGVSHEQALAARQAALDARLDTQHVGIHVPPEPERLPPAYYTSVLGLGLLVLLTTVALARTQVLTLRGYLGRLVSVGLTTRWVRHVLLVQSAVVVGVSTVLALLVAIPPVLVATWRMPDLVLTIPWAWLGLTTGVFYAATVLATLLAARRIRSVDRTVV
jgi:putative ABC transport system permease protein